MSETLYDKYGGFASITTIVQRFYALIQDTESLDRYFQDVEMDRLIDHQIKFLCMVLGGPNNYEGRALAVAHSRLGITDGAFGAVAGLLVQALTEAGVEAADIDTIVGVVAGTKPEIVTA
ncbi:MAG: group 1 truncated hemoglobin [Candidatus Sericytochromatia bacterium]|nr:group 1 truncated hemoglobin [Candidatus Sericytochromatia bacterium]